MRSAVNPATPIAAGETAGRVALETTRARRRVNGMKAASARPCGMHSTATAETTTAAVKTSTAAVASTAAAVEAATATAAMGASLCRVCEHEHCDRAREDRGERQRNLFGNLFAGSFQHVFLHLMERRSGTPAPPGDALETPWGDNKFRRRDQALVCRTTRFAASSRGCTGRTA